MRLRGCGQNCESHSKTESWQVCYWPSLIFQGSILDPSLSALLVLFIEINNFKVGTICICQRSFYSLSQLVSKPSQPRSIYVKLDQLVST